MLTDPFALSNYCHFLTSLSTTLSFYCGFFRRKQQTSITNLLIHYKPLQTLTNCRAVNIEVQGGDGGSISVHKCNFTSNTGQGPGGAIHLYQLSGQTTIKIRDSDFINNRVRTT